jgi:NAD(P)H-flavin reductase
MHHFFCSILETRLEGEKLVSATLPRPSGLAIVPGQYLLAHAPALDEILPTPLFYAGWDANSIEIAPPLPLNWTSGLQLALRGPLGKGFHLPISARKVLLISLDTLPHRLLPLARLALAQDASVSLFAHSLPASLPEEIEILHLEELQNALQWADYLALDLTLEQLPGLLNLLHLESFQKIPCPAQALFYSPMPCGGTADCGICALHTRRGTKLACKDGPVFNLEELDL